MGAKLEAALGILNGAVGDYLVRTANPLAIEMQLVHAGAPLALRRDAMRAAYPEATARVVVLVHGLMCTEDVWRLPDGSDYGALLARDLGLTPLYVRYNSGRAIPDNGAELDRLLEALLDAYPVPIEEVVLLGFSAGGLVIRSATHAASLSGHAWLARVRRALYVATPHLGAPLERVGRVVTKALYAFGEATGDPYTRLLADLGELRSDGVKDLGDADVRHEDRARREHRFSIRDPEHPVPLLAAIQHYLVAGALSANPVLATLFGDPMVPVPSATNGHCRGAETLALPPSHVRFLPGRSHMQLAHDPEVYAQLRAWLGEAKP